LGEVGLALVILDPAPVDPDRPLSDVSELELETGFGVLGVGLQRTGQAIDEGDLETVDPALPGGGDKGRGPRQRFERKAHAQSS
jgi:hypothetical protein